LAVATTEDHEHAHLEPHRLATFPAPQCTRCSRERRTRLSDNCGFDIHSSV